MHAPEDHRWSSYRAYLGLRPVAPFLAVRPVLDLAGGPQELAAFTEDPRTTPSVEDVRRLVECAIAVDDLDPSANASGRTHAARSVLVLLGERSSDPRLRRWVEGVLQHRSPKARHESVRRAEARLATDDTLARTLAWVEDALATPACSVPGTEHAGAQR